MSDSSRLPARPSLEQLHKQSKELLREYRAGDTAVTARFHNAISRLNDEDRSDPVTLADAQLVIAREYGFESWAKLKHHIESIRASGLAPFERLATSLAAAYSSGDPIAIREINWGSGTSFVWDHEPIKMQARLPRWFASETRTPDIALADAQEMVAHSYGFANWAAFVANVSKPAGDLRSAPGGMSSTPPFFKVDWKENTLAVRGPQSDKDWDAICKVMEEHRITRLSAGGMTDDGMERVTRLRHVTHLLLDNSNLLTDEGVGRLAQMPQLQELDLSGFKGVITDRGIEVLRYLPDLRRFQMCWQQNVTDAGTASLADCDRLENVNLMGTPTGDGVIRALAGKKELSQFRSGRAVTDDGLALLHQFPVFNTWQGGKPSYSLMSAQSGPTHLMVDGPFTDKGLASLAGLDGLFGLSFFWHCPSFTAGGLEPLKNLANLGFLGCEGQRCNDEAMRHISAMPRLRMLMAQGTVASDAGFAALSRSQSIEYIWGRECPNLTGPGFAALAAMPALRGLAVSLKNVDGEALSTLPRFPALRELMPMDVTDDGFLHVGRCDRLEGLWCMYCRTTGDAATGHIAALSGLKTYYAGATQITDVSLEMLGQMYSIEKLEFWACPGITDQGVTNLARLPRLREISLDGLAGVTREAAALFPAHVHVSYSG